MTLKKKIEAAYSKDYHLNVLKDILDKNAECLQMECKNGYSAFTIDCPYEWVSMSDDLVNNMLADQDVSVEIFSYLNLARIKVLKNGNWKSL